ncbi:MAG: S-layer homology domain-containing protein [Thainema sp.]
MTQSPPPDPQSNRRLSIDELIAIAVTFPIMGAILWWGMGRPTGSLLSMGPLSGQSDSLQDGLFAPFITEDDEDAEAEEPEAALPTLIPVPAPEEEEENVSTSRRTSALPLIGARPTRSEADEIETETVLPARTAASPEGEATTETAPEEPSQVAVTFPDVSSEYWAAPFIAELAERDVISGFPDGSFSPDQPVSRAGYAAILAGAFDQPSESQTATNYGDISADFWAQDAIAEASSSGFLKGYPGNQFRPDTNLTRAEAIVALANGLDLQPPENPDDILNRYSDADQIPDYARGAIAAATQAGLISNYPDLNQFEPSQPATRADIAAMVYQGLVQIGQAEPVESEYVVQE